MKKNDLKKMALMGITGGIMLASQGAFANEAAQNTILLAGHGCGGGSCGSHGAGSTKYSGQGCGGHSGSYGNTHGCSSYHESGSCGARNGYRGDIAESDVVVPPTHPSTAPSTTDKPAGQLMSEQELNSQLSNEGKFLFSRLSPEGKSLAIKLASASCKGQNDCKGLGSCKTNEHACAGLNGCKGQSQCAFKDKNKAVKVAAMRMAEKRGFIQSN